MWTELYSINQYQVDLQNSIFDLEDLWYLECNWDQKHPKIQMDHSRWWDPTHSCCQCSTHHGWNQPPASLQLRKQYVQPPPPTKLTQFTHLKPKKTKTEKKKNKKRKNKGLMFQILNISFENCQNDHVQKSVMKRGGRKTNLPSALKIYATFRGRHEINTIKWTIRDCLWARSSFPCMRHEPFYQPQYWILLTPYVQEGNG